MKNNKIYLAHPFDRRDSKRKEMIIRKLEEMGYDVLDPFEGEDDLCEKYKCDNYYQNPTGQFADDIVERDFAHVDECGSIFCWIPKGVTMIGTIREYAHAIDEGQHIIILCYKPNPFLRDAHELYLSYDDFLNGKEFVWA